MYQNGFNPGWLGLQQNTAVHSEWVKVWMEALFTCLFYSFFFRQNENMYMFLLELGSWYYYEHIQLILGITMIIYNSDSASASL